MDNRKLSEEAGLDQDVYTWNQIQLERFAELVRQDERHKFWDALMSDLEHGVKSLNERASERFAKEYPALNGKFKKEQA